MALSIDGILFDVLTGDPGSPVEGQVWYNTTEKKLKIYRNGAIDILIDKTAFDAHANSTSNPHGTTLEQARTSGNTLSGAINMNTNVINNLGAGSTATDAAQRGWVSDQIKSKLAGLDWQESVLNFTNTPPGVPNDGDRYVVTAVASGAWAGKENQIAQYNSATPGWDYTVPNEGYCLRDETANATKVYDGATWGNVGNTVDHAALLNLTTGDPHTQYQQESERNQINGYCGLDGSAEIGDTRHGNRSGGALHTAVSSTGAGFMVQSHRSATVNPTVSDDSTAGWLPGARWTNTTAGTDWVCISNGVGAAVWKETTNVAGILSNKANSVLAASFAGNPKKATVTFGTVFPSANYSAVLTAVTTGNVTYTLVVESQLAGSFVINVGANNIANLTKVNWYATMNGEST